MQPETQNTKQVRTKRLLLRQPQEADAAAIAELADNFAVTRYTAVMPNPYTIADARGWIAGIEEQWAGGAADFAVCLNEEAETLIGICSYHVPNGPSAGELGYWYGEPFWGRGYATEAANALIAHAFARYPDATEMRSDCHVENSASRGVLEKCGFHVIGKDEGWFEALQENVELTLLKLERAQWSAAQVR